MLHATATAALLTQRRVIDFGVACSARCRWSSATSPRGPSRPRSLHA